MLPISLNFVQLSIMGHTNALIIAGALLLRFLIFYSADTFDQADNIPCADDEVQPVFISNDVAETVAGINSNRHLWKCHFDKTYHRMRTNFIEMAKKSSLSIHSYPLENYPDLTTDVAVIEGSKFNSNILVHISGTHGPEGYAGSATQVSSH